MSRISFFGTGYVGLVSAVCLADFGHQVLCMDKEKERIQTLSNGVAPFFEPGLEALLSKNLKDGRLHFTSDSNEAVEHGDVIMIAVGTPPLENGKADLSHIFDVARSIGQFMDSYKVIATKSTVPVGTAVEIRKIIEDVLTQRGLHLAFDVVSNPEFLREGSAIQDFTHPDRVVLGCDSEHAFCTMQLVYRSLNLREIPLVATTPETAELSKYASNAFLATKISFINEVANLCEKVGANVHDIAKVMGLDQRIGKYFLHPGPGYGGSCFPKDTQALVKIGEEHGVAQRIVETVIQVNDAQKQRVVDQLIESLNTLEGKTIGILGLAFKQNTDDMREAPALKIVRELAVLGAKLQVFDPVAMENAKMEFKDLSGDQLEFCSNELETTRNADALLILTEWNQFRNLDFDSLSKVMKQKKIFDFRNLYDRALLEAKGFFYKGLGR
jgi:UDPglucose 6-dehydrogenase